jgi:hypothetical protein
MDLDKGSSHGLFGNAVSVSITPPFAMSKAEGKKIGFKIFGLSKLPLPMGAVH